MNASGIIGLFMRIQTMNSLTSPRYRNMLKNFLRPELQNFARFNEDIWFQQDKATAHTTNLLMKAVRTIFPRKVIFKQRDINWPPKSLDLTPIDFFL